MGSFDGYCGTEKWQRLLREDLDNQLKDSQEFKDFKQWVRDSGIADVPQILTRWESVPRDALEESGIRTHLEEATSHTSTILSRISEITDVQTARSKLEGMQSLWGNMARNLKHLRKFEYILWASDTRGMHEFFKEAEGLKGAVGSLERKLTQFIETARTSLEQEKQNALKAAKEAKGAAESAKADAAGTGMAVFANKFSAEAVTADAKADHAGKWIKWTIFGGAFMFVGFIVLDLSTHNSVLAPGSSAEWLRWLALRLGLVSLFVFVLSYWLRERRNFLHVGIANRHRANLCNAYVAVSGTSADVKEKLRILMKILPTVASLGKTGFIPKEEAADVPSAEILKTLKELKS